MQCFFCQVKNNLDVFGISSMYPKCVAFVRRQKEKKYRRQEKKLQKTLQSTVLLKYSFTRGRILKFLHVPSQCQALTSSKDYSYL